MKTRIARTLLIGFIWLVTAIDIWCCQWLTVDQELNPMARWIISEHGLWTMIAMKVMGTWVVTETLRYLRIMYSAVIAVFMAVLLLILGGVIPV